MRSRRRGPVRVQSIASRRAGGNSDDLGCRDACPVQIAPASAAGHPHSLGAAGRSRSTMPAFSAVYGRSTAATMGCSTTVYGRLILQKLLTGDICGALEGGEKVFYYGGPGLRYFRALEHIVFGESLSRLLISHSSAADLSFAKLFRRFLPEPWSLTLIFIFIAIPVGLLFGTTFTNYAKLAAKGFADPAAYILFFCAASSSSSARRLPDQTREFRRHFSARCLLALGDFHEADRCARRRGFARRRRTCRALSAAMAAACRFVYRLLAGVLDGLAQLDLRPRVRSVQFQRCKMPIFW